MDRTHYCSRCLTTFQQEAESCPNLSCRTRRPQGGWGTLLKVGDTLDRTYSVDKMLAIGGAGVTYLGHELDDEGDKTGPPLAIKVLYAKRDQGAFLRRLANEAQILLELDHPNIVKIMGFVQRKGHSPYLVTQFEKGGSLLDHLRRNGPLPLRAVAGLGTQLCDALHVAHGAGVVHRDLKPENILLAELCPGDQVPRVRLTDFGIAKVFGGVGERLTRVGAFVGTPQYAAPEQFEGVSPTAATDVFAMAAVLRFCATLRPHLPDPDMAHPEDTLRALHERLPALLEGEDQDTHSFNAFLQSTLAIEPGDRPDLPTARGMLQRISEGREVIHSTRTAVPDFSPLEDNGSTFAFERVTPSEDPKQVDTLEGILSRDSTDEVLKAGTARHPQEPGEPVVRVQALPAFDELKTGLTEFEGFNPEAPGDPPPAADPAETEPTQNDRTERVDPEPDPPKKKSRGGCCLFLAMLLGCAGIAAPGAVWYQAPWKLPSAVLDLLPAAQAPSGEDQAVLIASIQAQREAMRQGCIGDQTLQVTIVIEPTGRIRSATPQIAAEEERALALCLATNLRELTFDRAASTPVILTLEL